MVAAFCTSTMRDAISPSTLSRSSLKEKNFITTDHAGMLVLTDEGRQIAERTLDRHHVLTKLLESVGIPHDQAQIDACKVEHDLSEESFQALKILVESGKLDKIPAKAAQQ